MFHVSNLIKDNMTWDVTLVKSVFLPIDLERILSLPLLPISCNDHFVLLVFVDGKFNVKRAYWLDNAMQDTTDPSPSPSDGRLLTKF